jgi:hypothetical protein
MAPDFFAFPVPTANNKTDSSLKASSSLITQALHHLPHPLDGKGGLAQGTCRDAEELGRIIVRRRPVGAQGPTATAAVDDGPLASPADPDGDGVHKSPTVALAVSRLYVHMETHKTVGAVVTVVAPRPGGKHQTAALLTGKYILTGMGLIIAFFVLFSLIFSIHFGFLLKIDGHLPGGVRIGLTQTSRSAANHRNIMYCIHKTDLLSSGNTAAVYHRSLSLSRVKKRGARTKSALPSFHF